MGGHIPTRWKREQALTFKGVLAMISSLISSLTPMSLAF